MVCFLCLAATTIMCTSVFAQSADHATRPPDSFGQGVNRPDGVPQRPPESYGQHGQRPADAGIQRPPESYGQQGQRLSNAPQRPAGSFGHRGGR